MCDYVHLNPVRAKLLKADEALESFRWSSYGEYLKAPNQRPIWLRVDRLFGEKGIPRDSEAGRKHFALLMERRRSEESATDYEELRCDWVLGSEQFRKELLAAASERVVLSHYGSERQETAVQKAERLLQEQMPKLGVQKKELRLGREGDQAKVALARSLRQQTTMSLRWIAARLQMGSWTYVSNLLSAQPRPANRDQTVLPLFQ